MGLDMYLVRVPRYESKVTPHEIVQDIKTSEKLDIVEYVGYWRKANHIHNWFVKNVQDGEDDCCYHKEVTREILVDLLQTCTEVLASCELVHGRVRNGWRIQNGVREDIYSDGIIVKDTTVAENLLPTCSGFFFGSTDYDEWYVEDIAGTVKIIEGLLSETDFEKQAIYYVSSW